MPSSPSPATSPVFNEFIATPSTAISKHFYWCLMANFYIIQLVRYEFVRWLLCWLRQSNNPLYYYMRFWVRRCVLVGSKTGRRDNAYRLLWVKFRDPMVFFTDFSFLAVRRELSNRLAVPEFLVTLSHFVEVLTFLTPGRYVNPLRVHVFTLDRIRFVNLP